MSLMSTKEIIKNSRDISKSWKIDRVVSEVTTTSKTYIRNPSISQYAKIEHRVL